MQDRITKAQLEERCANVNRRLALSGSAYRYAVGYRYGYTAIDRARAADGALLSTVRAGMTKREAGEYFHAMMTALDDAATLEGGRS